MTRRAKLLIALVCVVPVFVSGQTASKPQGHGEGLDPATREQLFYPFYRLEERTPNLGPGLGLAIAKGFVDLMGGELWVEDTPGGGATFAFSLPRAAKR